MFEVINRDHIRRMARAAAESAVVGTNPVVVNPYPPESEAHTHFDADFLAAQKELIDGDWVDRLHDTNDAFFSQTEPHNCTQQG